MPSPTPGAVPWSSTVVEGRLSGGFDLGVMYGDDFARIIELVDDGGDLVRRLWGRGVPVVAACTGHAIAAGALIAGL